MAVLKYRPEIDGLRAIAVVPVVLYHAAVPGFGGGFVGVDVFFVISGFLITSIILKEIDVGEFSIVNFWARRARRILPPLFGVLVIVNLIYFLFFLPSDLKRTALASAAQAMYVSNFWFLRETSGYFTPGAETMPLLHTWSLSVEEQFYLVIPLLLLFGTWLSRYAALTIIILILLASFLANVWVVNIVPEKSFDVLWIPFIFDRVSNVDAGFYLPFYRAWELGIGSVIAFWDRRALSLGRWSELLVIAGLFAILGSVFYIDSNTLFPGVWALIPTLGTASIIIGTARGSTYLSRILSVRPLVWCGLISYSLYLWHWPVLVVGRQLWGEGAMLVVALCLASVILAWISYVTFESPIRRLSARVSNRLILSISILTMGLIVVIGIATYIANGFPGRLPEDVLKVVTASNIGNSRTAECHSNLKVERLESLGLCTFGKISGHAGQLQLVAMGDSHLDAVYPALQDMAEKHGVYGGYASYSACIPIVGVKRKIENINGCVLPRRWIYGYVKQNKTEHVLLVGRWTLNIGPRLNGSLDALIAPLNDAGEFSEEKALDAFEGNLARMARTLNNNGSTLWIMRQVPLQKTNAAKQLAQRRLMGLDRGRDLEGVNWQSHIERQRAANQIIDSVAARFPNVKVLDPTPLLCDRIKGCAVVSDEGMPLYRDEHHLSRFGAFELKPLFEEMFATITNQSDGI